MRQPKFTFDHGRWEARYVQVPYDNRYFRVFYKGIKVAEFPGHLIDNWRSKSIFLFPFVGELYSYSDFATRTRFHNWLDYNVKKYDEWLDRTDS